MTISVRPEAAQLVVDGVPERNALPGHGRVRSGPGRALRVLRRLRAWRSTSSSRDRLEIGCRCNRARRWRSGSLPRPASSWCVSEREKPSARTLRVLAFPVGMLVIFFLIPFGIMVATSFYQRIEGAFYEPAFELERAGSASSSRLFLERAVFSIGICLLAGFVCITVAFPFTYFLTRMRRRPPGRAADRRAFRTQPLRGDRRVLVVHPARARVRCLEHPRLAGRDERGRGLPARLRAPSCSGLSYIAFPYCVLTLYPQLTRLDPEITEAAQTLGRLTVADVLDGRRADRAADRRGRLPPRVRLHAGELSDRRFPRTPRALDALGLHREAGVRRMRTCRSRRRWRSSSRCCRSPWSRWWASSSPGRGPHLDACLALDRSQRLRRRCSCSHHFSSSPSDPCNENRYLNFPPEGFSLAWYRQLFTDSGWRSARSGAA